MALEALLTEMTAALKENTAALKAGGGKAATATTTKAPGKPAIDAATLKAVAMKVMDVKGKPFAKKLIKEIGGAVDLANVKPEKFNALHAALEAALTAAEEPEAEAADEDEL